ncbi:MAG: M20 family metallopeptidase [Trueperaceae bacterium]
MTDIQRYFESAGDSLLTVLREMVEIESPTLEPDRVNKFGEYVQTKLRALGAEVELDRQTERGHNVIGRFGGSAKGERQVLMIGHMDTVFAAGTLAQRPFRIDGDRAYGPGTADMKSGLVIMLAAMEALKKLGLTPNRPVTMIFNSDEEMQSRISRPLIEREAEQSAYALVFEGSDDLSTYTNGRKASGRFKISTRGVAAHAASGLKEGVNAIEELAHQVVAAQKMTDFTVGTTVSIGTITGGERPNVVPAAAEAEFSVRAVTKEEMVRIEASLRALEPVLPRAQLDVTGGFHRPPFEPKMVSAELAAALARAGAAVGLNMKGQLGGGGSDANLTAGVGTPSVDGLGAVGFGAHGIDEYVVISSLKARAALAAHLLLEL